MTTRTGAALLTDRQLRMPMRCGSDAKSLREGAVSLSQTLSEAMQTKTTVRCLRVVRTTDETDDTAFTGHAGQEEDGDTGAPTGRAVRYDIGEEDAASMASAVFADTVEGILVGRVAEAIMRAGVKPLAATLGPATGDAEAPRLQADYQASWQSDNGDQNADFSLSCSAGTGEALGEKGLGAVPIGVEAMLGYTHLTFGQVRSLRPGQTFPVDHGGLEDIAISVGGAPYRRGEMGKAGGKRTVRLTT